MERIVKAAALSVPRTSSMTLTRGFRSGAEVRGDHRRGATAPPHLLSAHPATPNLAGPSILAALVPAAAHARPTPPAGDAHHAATLASRPGAARCRNVVRILSKSLLGSETRSALLRYLCIAPPTQTIRIPTPHFHSGAVSSGDSKGFAAAVIGEGCCQAHHDVVSLSAEALRSGRDNDLTAGQVARRSRGDAGCWPPRAGGGMILAAKLQPSRDGAGPRRSRAATEPGRPEARAGLDGGSQSEGPPTAR